MEITEYRGVYARNPRNRLQRGGPVRHIGGYDGTPGGNPRRPRMADKSLCHVFIAWYPESGDQGKPGNATCKACLAAWRKLDEHEPVQTHGPRVACRWCKNPVRQNLATGYLEQLGTSEPDVCAYSPTMEHEVLTVGTLRQDAAQELAREFGNDVEEWLV